MGPHLRRLSKSVLWGTQGRPRSRAPFLVVMSECSLSTAWLHTGPGAAERVRIVSTQPEHGQESRVDPP